MDRTSDAAIEIINGLHTERLDYETEYIPLIDCANQCKSYEDTGHTPEEIKTLNNVLIGKMIAQITEFEGIQIDRLRALAEADRDGRCLVLPCKLRDVCYEVDAGHGIIKHTVTGLTVYNRGADGKRYITDINNSIVIDTWAVGDDGCEWPDHYSAEEWGNRILTRAEAEAALKKEDKP